MKKTKYEKKRKKFENNWRSKSLESLEKDYWGPVPKEEGYLVSTCYSLRKKPLKELEVEDLRILIGQDIGLKYLIPLALEVLEKDILAEGDFYEGDLLKSVLTSDVDYWKLEKEDWNKMVAIYEKDIQLINGEATIYGAGRELIKAFSEFEKIN